MDSELFGHEKGAFNGSPIVVDGVMPIQGDGNAVRFPNDYCIDMRTFWTLSTK